jgi:hypothetical protein
MQDKNLWNWHNEHNETSHNIFLPVFLQVYFGKGEKCIKLRILLVEAVFLAEWVGTIHTLLKTFISIYIAFHGRCRSEIGWEGRENT